MKAIIFPLLCAALLGGCARRSTDDARQIVVSILPLKHVVEAIVGDDFRIGVLVPPGSSPETWEPTLSQVMQLADAQAVITTGLMDFERRLLSEDRLPLVDLSQGIALIEGHEEHVHAGHARGADPHIWLSPHNLRQMARTLHAHLARSYPDSTKYHDNLVIFERRMDSLDVHLQALARGRQATAFIIYHPALSYLARDYGLRQTAIEQEGKEPSAEQLGALIRQARSPEIAPMVLYQREFSPATVEVLAREIGVECVEIDPLAEQVDANLRHIMELITATK